jgi:hypothetical protein
MSFSGENTWRDAGIKTLEIELNNTSTNVVMLCSRGYAKFGIHLSLATAIDWIQIGHFSSLDFVAVN